MRAILRLLILLLTALLPASHTFGEDKTLRIGFIGSLSSFAANYGTAVLKGAQVALSELEDKGIRVAFIVEDDQSDTKNAVSAYNKLARVDKVQGIIGGSWWINAVVKSAERDKIPLLSCETLYNGDFIPGRSYFVLQGDLRDWVKVYAPVVSELGLMRGSIIHFVSGFGSTIADEFKALFSEPGRTFTGAIEYTDIQVPNASALVLLAKAAKPDVLYVDAQPAGYATILRRLKDIGLEKLVIFGQSALADAVRDGLVDASAFPNLYATRRATFAEDFRRKYRAKHHEDPILNADLGYYAMHLLSQGLQTTDAIAALKSGITVSEKRFVFDERNVHTAAPQAVTKLSVNAPAR